ncbi:MAG: hypothetical protein JXB05_09410 [Myxococcaceae bacterium]|nr:hypothetical protein [Myxococcaceae bacterium]
MARHDREERQHRRWLEDARKHLGRGDLEGTLSALLRLPPPLREELLPLSAALFRQVVQEQHRRGAWGPLSTLAVRADAEPGLVERGVEAEEARATYWPLLWAAGRARDWARAQRLWRPLASAAQERAPRLATALDSWLSTQGAPDPETLMSVLAAPSLVDSRLGIEPVRAHAALPAPRSVAEVEGAVLALCAMEPFGVFASRVETWAREAPAEVARTVWELAGQLAARELWIRATAGQGGAALWKPAQLLARAVREGEAPQGLSEPTLQALRLVSSGLPREGVPRAEEAEAWCALAHSAALQPEARPWVVQAAAGIRFSGPAVPRALRLYEALLALAPDAGLWARAMLSWSEWEPEAPTAPGWLQESLRRLLSTKLPALRAWLKGASPSERGELIDGVASACAPELVEAWVDACWEGADEELRRVLSGAISTLLDRSREKKAGREMDQLLRGTQDPEEAFRILTQVEGALEQAQALMKLPPEGLRTWRRFASRVLPYRAEFLEVAVRQAASDTEAWEAAERYLEAHPGDTGHIEVLRTMEVLGRGELARRALARWLERRANDVQALAEAAMAAERMNTPCEYLHPMLEAFMRAWAERPPAESPTGVLKQAQALARRHGYRLRKRRAPRKKKSSKASAGGAPRPKRAKAAARQESLFEQAPGTESPQEDGDRSGRS